VLFLNQLESHDNVVVEAHGQGLENAVHVLLGCLFEAWFAGGDVELGQEFAYYLIEEGGAVHVLEKGL